MKIEKFSSKKKKKRIRNNKAKLIMKSEIELEIFPVLESFHIMKKNTGIEIENNTEKKFCVPIFRIQNMQMRTHMMWQ